MNLSICWNVCLSDSCNCGTTDSDSGSSSGSELDTAKASEPLSNTKVIGVHMVSHVMYFDRMQFSSASTSIFVKNTTHLQENVGPGLTSDQNRGDPSNPETGKGGCQS